MLKKVHPQTPSMANRQRWAALLTHSLQVRDLCCSAPAQLPGDVSVIYHSFWNLPAMQETWVQYLDQKDPLEKEMATHSFSSLGNPMDRGAWQATVHGVAESQTWLSDQHTVTSFWVSTVIADLWSLANSGQFYLQTSSEFHAVLLTFFSSTLNPFINEAG